MLGLDFLGTPTVCCFKDYDCNQNNEDNCFQTPDRQRTCDPKHRDLSEPVCRNEIKEYCTGEKLFPTQSNWKEMWLEDSLVEVNSGMKLSDVVYNAMTIFQRDKISVRDRGFKYPYEQKQPCLRAIARNLTKQRICSWDDIQEGTVITGNYDPEGLEWGREILNKVFERFESESENGLLDSINNPGLNTESGFYNTLWEICNKVPLLCTNGNFENAEGILPKLCSNVNAENLANNPNVIKWCACHMPDSEYNDYRTKFNLSKECTPLCNREGVIPSINSDGERGYCTQNTCFMDPNSVSITESQFSQDATITFRQLCPGCGKGNVRRRYDLQHYTNDDQIFYSIPQPYVLAEGKEYYDLTYGMGYSESNFSSPDRIIECVFTTVKELTELGIYPEDYESATLPFKNSKGKNWDSITVKFGTTILPSGKGSIKYSVIGVVNVVTDNIIKEEELGKDFVVLFTTVRLENSFQKLLFYTNIGENETIDPVIAGDTSGENRGSLAKPFGDPLVLKLNQKFQEENVDFFSETKYSSFEGVVDASVCSCTMENFNLSILNSKFNGKINFAQECGQSTCIEDGKTVSCANEDQNPQEVRTLEYIQTITAQKEAQEEYSLTFNILISLAVFILILYFVYILIHKSK